MAPPTEPFTDQVTPALPPVTVAVNWLCPMSATCAVCGLRDTVTAAGVFPFGAVVEFPPQSSMKVALRRMIVATHEPANLRGSQETER